MRGGNQLDPPAGDGPGDLRVGGEPQLVHDDCFRAVVDDGLQDDPRLPGPRVRRPLVVGQRNLEAAGAPDRRMGDLPISTDLVAGVGDHDPAV